MTAGRCARPTSRSRSSTRNRPRRKHGPRIDRTPLAGGFMSNAPLDQVAIKNVANASAIMTGLIALNVVFSIVANAAFRVSARSATWTDILTWQVLGNLAGLITVVSLTGLLRYLPLAIAFPMTTGMSILAVQIVAAKWLFHEQINAMQWTGSLLIGVGIFLVQR